MPPVYIIILNYKKWNYDAKSDQFRWEEDLLLSLRKQQEKEIEDKFKKFKSLATHFKKSIEQDRKFLAVELHEELAQLATVVKMDIQWLNDGLTDTSTVFGSRMEHALMISELLINTIRRISYGTSTC